MSGVHKPTKGKILIEGKEVNFTSPRDAMNAGIATVYQDLAMIPLMSVTRNFWMGASRRRASARSSSSTLPGPTRSP